MPSDRAGLTEREATEFAWFDFRPSANEALQRPTRRPRPHIHGIAFEIWKSRLSATFSISNESVSVLKIRDSAIQMLRFPLPTGTGLR